MDDTGPARPGAAAALTPLAPSRSLTEEVVEVLRARIVAGDFASGQQLVQAEVARLLGVSRGPVREALNQLKAEGLVRDEPRRGTFVARPEPEDIRDALDLRLALEVRAAQLVMDRADPAAVAPVATAFEDLIAAIRRGHADGIGGADLAFHEAICRASGNRLLHSVFTSQAARVTILMRVDELSYRSRPEVLVEEHRELLECLRGRDKERIQTLLTVHIEGLRDRILAAWSHPTTGSGI
ncbi:putative Uncharacterized HTH-type transcriptional regulator in instable DNA locus [Nostocoides japonicum T1-X7]|uniref:Putative Uncharacterized HTH-type transcriptional regulator in instable DNA locus n=1 Tax=Nostocoides japonicum T1-X7 TaxID=1194083 RepID=A0A077LYC5_9MICO|nr:GntR family transcriptional regulator [Tetrasphaera japonica]CCH76950.1 putative Uncharacterized HTH-type transcriptional regulator in instable DNA locus [Tetrasphaera japonica T1-X7]